MILKEEKLKNKLAAKGKKKKMVPCRNLKGSNVYINSVLSFYFIFVVVVFV
jgi:hypothetical protein